MTARAWTAAALLFLLAALPGCRQKNTGEAKDPLRSAFDTVPDVNDPAKIVPLTYQQAQGKRVFETYCVWCHADATPAGPSNRSNVTPTPALISDGAALNGLSDEYLQNIITLGGSAVGKSAMMPPYGQTLKDEDIRAAIAYARAVAQPPYHPPARPGPKYSVK
jgi:mono/diheme cytochrome c family protein